MIIADAHTVLTNFNLIFGIVATLAAVVLGFLSAKNKITIISLEESNKAYAALHETDKLQLESYKQQLDLSIQKSEVLENQVTQAPSISKLALQLGTQHKEMMTAMNGMTQELGNVAKAVSGKTRNAGK